MANVSKLKIGDTSYDVCDTTARTSATNATTIANSKAKAVVPYQAKTGSSGATIAANSDAEITLTYTNANLANYNVLDVAMPKIISNHSGSSGRANCVWIACYAVGASGTTATIKARIKNTNSNSITIDVEAYGLMIPK